MPQAESHCSSPSGSEYDDACRNAYGDGVDAPSAAVWPGYPEWTSAALRIAAC